MTGRADDAVEPFVLDVPEADLDDLRCRLRAARLPDRETGDGEAAGGPSWSQGVPLQYLEELRRYWLDGYDWRRLESELNELGQWTTSIEGLRVHFVHLRSTRSDARPLLLTHGWPGSVVEYLDVARELAEPTEPDAPAFHLVVPSLPGFAFSGRPAAAGWGVERIAGAWATLMDRLGYDRFLAQGGDWGALVTTELAVRHPGRVLGMHTTFPQVDEPSGWGWDDGALEPEERRWLAETRRFWESGTGYARQLAARPQTVGYGLVDSPVALLAWVVDAFAEWTDTGSSPEEAIPRDRLLDDVMLHWLGGSGASAARIYWESYGRVDRTARVLVPTAVSVFPREIEKLPRAWVAHRHVDLVRWSVLDRGGHFPSLEVPDLFVAEVRAAFADGGGAPSDSPPGSRSLPRPLAPRAAPC